MCLDSAPAGRILCYCWGNSNLPALDGAIFVKSSTVFLYQDKQKKKKYILIVPFNYGLHKLHYLWSLANGNFSLEYLRVVWASLNQSCLIRGFSVSVITVGLRLLDIYFFTLQWSVDFQATYGSCQFHYRPVSTFLVFPSSACCEETCFLCLALLVEYFRVFILRMIIFQECPGTGVGTVISPSFVISIHSHMLVLNKACSSMMEVFFTQGEFSLKILSL